MLGHPAIQVFSQLPFNTLKETRPVGLMRMMRWMPINRFTIKVDKEELVRMRLVRLLHCKLWRRCLVVVVPVEQVNTSSQHSPVCALCGLLGRVLMVGGQNNNAFMGMAMSEAAKMFDQHDGQGNVQSGNKQDAVSSAAGMAMKLLSSSSGGVGTGGSGIAGLLMGGGGGGAGQLMGLVGKFM
jgi:hypothetical protein